VSGNIAVDTNAVIAYREGIPKVQILLEESTVIILPAPVYGELLFGAFNSDRRMANVEAVESFRKLTTFVPISVETVVRYAELRADLRKQGTPIPENGIWIAATCRQLDIPLATNDDHFQRIPGLRVIGWQ
jgi:tRNA(fMet)-specific endonuclease VapC